MTRHRDAILVGQYRHRAGDLGFELPAGYVNRGETPEACARRELLEETGYAAPSPVPLGSFLAVPGFLRSRWIW